MDVDPVLVALVDQQSELSGVLADMTEGDWTMPSRCAGWSVSDVVLHLAQTNELALASLRGTFAEATATLGGGVTGSTVDETVDDMVVNERGRPNDMVFERWQTSAEALRSEFESFDLSQRVRWVAGELSARTLATTRLAETWIHTGDVAEALGVALVPADRLRHIARLAWRTLPYAFARAGRSLTGPVSFELRGPLGDHWSFVPKPDPLTTIRGDADDLCLVAARRVEPCDTSLEGEGPDAAAVFELVRTYA